MRAFFKAMAAFLSAVIDTPGCWVNPLTRNRWEEEEKRREGLFLAWQQAEDAISPTYNQLLPSGEEAVL